MVLKDRVTLKWRSAGWQCLHFVSIAALIGIVSAATGTLAGQQSSPNTTQIPDQNSPKLGEPAYITVDGMPKDHLVADSSRLYFNLKTKQGWVIAYSSQTPGSAAITLPLKLHNPKVLDVSSASELLVSAAITRAATPELWIVSPSRGKLRRLGIRSSVAAWASDGKIIFLKQKDFYRAEHDGSHPVKFTTAPGPPFEIAMSPDGSRMRFTIGDPHKIATMWDAQADGSNMRAILPLPMHRGTPVSGWGQQCCGRWTSDGKYFVYETAGDISVVTGAGSVSPANPPEQLTSGGMAYHDPVTSTDGKKIFAIGAQRTVAGTTENSPQDIYSLDWQMR